MAHLEKGRSVIEPPKRLSESILWTLQRNFYDQNGGDVWKNNLVPSFILSNCSIADSYARMTVARLTDAVNSALDGSGPPLPDDEPFYILELGAGSGKFSFHFLNAFSRRLRLAPEKVRTRKWVYILSDFTSGLQQVWLHHPALQTFFESGNLDIAIIDADKSYSDPIHLCLTGGSISPGSISTPLIVVANYLFDSLPHDYFLVDRNGSLFEGRIETGTQNKEEKDTTDPSIILRLDNRWEFSKVDLETYYESEPSEVTAALRKCVKEISEKGKVVMARSLSGCDYEGDEGSEGHDNDGEGGEEADEEENEKDKCGEQIKSEEDSSINPTSPASLPFSSQPQVHPGNAWALLIPIGALRCLSMIQTLSTHSTLFLAGDKGYPLGDILHIGSPPKISEHGSFSVMVNFDALSQFVESLSGFSYCTSRLDASIHVWCGLIPGVSSKGKRGGEVDAVDTGSVDVDSSSVGGREEEKEVEREERVSYLESEWYSAIDIFGPSDFFHLQQGIGASIPLSHTLSASPSLSPDTTSRALSYYISLLRLSHYDPEIFYKVRKEMCRLLSVSPSRMIEEAVRCVLKCASNFYLLTQGQDIPFEIGSFFHKAKRYKTALKFYFISELYFGPHCITYFNIGLASYHLDQLEKACEWFKKRYVMVKCVGS